MRRIWRFFFFFVTIIAHSVRLRRRLVGVPEEERAMYAARGQQKGAEALCRVLGVKVRLSGELPEQGAMLAVCNHLSFLDPLILSSKMPVSFAAKAEIENWPVIGWIARLVGVIFVVRERRMETSRFVDQVQDRIREGIRVLVFPEGTIGDGENVLPFKTGAFAAVAGMDDGSVLPLYLKGVSIDGAPAEGELYKTLVWTQGVPLIEHAWTMLRARNIEMEIRVGEPISTKLRDRKELASISYDAVVSLGNSLPQIS